MATKKVVVKDEKLSSPWEQIHHAYLAFFANDQDIKVCDIVKTADKGIYDLNIITSNIDKFRSLNRIAKKEYEFGNVTLKVSVSFEEVDEVDPTKDIETLLEDNEWFKEIKTIEIKGLVYNYCVFQKKVMQYFDDILSDESGIRSTLAQDVAVELFDAPGINFCTDKTEIN